VYVRREIVSSATRIVSRADIGEDPVLPVDTTLHLVPFAEGVMPVSRRLWIGVGKLAATVSDPPSQGGLRRELLNRRPTISQIGRLLDTVKHLVALSRVSCIFLSFVGASRQTIRPTGRHAAAVLPGFHPGSAHRSPRAAASISIFQALRKLDVQCRTGESTDFHEIISFLSFFAIRRFISLPLPFNMSTLYQTFVLHSTTNVCDDLR
jgi:hypothetical protein